MQVKVEAKQNPLKQMRQQAKKLDGKEVAVGALTGEHAWLAGIHEYGCHIPVTDKMRAWLHYQGIHLKKNTTEIMIPERSFIRSGFDSHIEEAVQNFHVMLDSFLQSDKSETVILSQFGKQLASMIQAYAAQLSDPPKSDASIALGASSNPLVDTGEMINGITYSIDGKVIQS
ncbi:MAG: hypothetical protein LUF89_02875 [Ruminococcus sp.]|nr:hypothetical protein [Ruminococcus sp.]